MLVLYYHHEQMGSCNMRKARSIKTATAMPTTGTVQHTRTTTCQPPTTYDTISLLLMDFEEDIAHCSQNTTATGAFITRLLK